MRNENLEGEINQEAQSLNIGQNMIREALFEQRQQFDSEIQLYEYIIQRQHFIIDRDVSKGEAACLTHVLLKAIVNILLYFKPIILNFLQDYFVNELMFFFAVADFWITKNYNGRKLAGLSWSFGKDMTGKQRFIFEYRINEQFVSKTKFRIFWMVQVLYIIFPFIYFYVEGLDYDLQQNKIFQFSLLVFIIILGVINLVLFYKASSYASRRKMLLKQRLPINYLPKLGTNSLISYI